jgi:hypothetical protein
MAMPSTNSSPPGSATTRRFRIAAGVAKLLLIIFLLLIVAGLIFPAVNFPHPHLKSKARNDCAQIVAAVKAYYIEYGKYPLGSHAVTVGDNSADFIFGHSPDSPSIGSGASNSELFDILRNVDSTGATPPGQPNRYNPKGIIFFEAPTATDTTQLRAGFVPANAKAPAHPGAYLDPWGTEYFIAIDADYNNQLTDLPYGDFNGKHAPVTGVAVFSLGKDQHLGTKGDGFYKNPSTSAVSDDIISWQ